MSLAAETAAIAAGRYGGSTPSAAATADIAAGREGAAAAAREEMGGAAAASAKEEGGRGSLRRGGCDVGLAMTRCFLFNHLLCDSFLFRFLSSSERRRFRPGDRFVSRDGRGGAPPEKGATVTKMGAPLPAVSPTKRRPDATREAEEAGGGRGGRGREGLGGAAPQR